MSGVIKKLSKKQRRLQKNIEKKAHLENELHMILQLSEDIVLRNNKIVMLIKEINKIHPHEISLIQKQTELKLENLIKSGTRVSKQKFDKPVKLSENLYNFLKIENENLMTRIEVVGEISKYIRKKNYKIHQIENYLI